MREEELSEIHFTLKFGRLVLHHGSVQTPSILPIEIGRHPDSPLSVTRMIEAAVENGLEKETASEVDEYLRRISRHHLSLLKHADRPGYLLTQHGTNTSHVVFQSTAGTRVEAPLPQDAQVPAIDATKHVEIEFPKPFKGATNALVLRLRITEPTS